MKNLEKNIAFVDGQNLHLGTTGDNWKIDLNKFRIYLKDRYKVSEAYYFLGYFSIQQESLYNNLKQAGFIVLFKDHDVRLIASKKGNVDSDIVFEAMRNVVDNKDFDRVVLVSGDGDYKKLVDYLIKKVKFRKLLFPNRRASSLYKILGSEYFDYLDSFDTKEKIRYK